MKPVKRKHRFLFWLRKRRGDPLNETRFTERAQTALRLAQECSAELGHGYVGSEHLLLGLSREGRGVAARVLQSAGLEPETLRAAIARTVGVGAPGVVFGSVGTTGSVGFTGVEGSGSVSPEPPPETLIVAEPPP